MAMVRNVIHTIMGVFWGYYSFTYLMGLEWEWYQIALIIIPATIVFFSMVVLIEVCIKVLIIDLLKEWWDFKKYEHNNPRPRVIK